MKRGIYSFKQWCIDKNKTWLLDCWHYDLNGCNPEDVSFGSNKKYYFWCGNEKHKPVQLAIYFLTNKTCKTTRDNFCVGCHSVGKFFEDNYSIDLLEKIWSDKNEKSPYEISAGCGQTIYLKCINDDTHPDYDLKAYNVKNSINCPCCAGKRVCDTNNLGVLVPEIIDLWSHLNNKTPFEYTKNSNQEVYLKCAEGKHSDYKRKICAHMMYGLRCPECSKDNYEYKRGPDSPHWNPDLPEDKRIRKSKEYSDWRTSIFEKDGYLCQCCLNKKHNKLNAHHIYSYAFHKDLRFNNNNGITLCKECHDSTYDGSLHHEYGTRDVTPMQLQTYINNKREALGIDDVFDIFKYMGSGTLSD